MDTLYKIIGLYLIVTERSAVLDQTRFAEGIEVEALGSPDLRAVHISLDLGVGFMARQDEEELKVSHFPYAKIVGRLVYVARLSS